MKVKIDGKHYEIYKIQIALFGGPAALIYNEDRTQMYETTDKDEVADLSNFIGSKKAFVAGKYNDKTEKIDFVKLLSDTNLF